MRCILTVLILVFATPALAEAFSDWRAECTDENLCVLVNRATGPAGEDVVLTLRRRPEADAPWQISVTVAYPHLTLPPIYAA